MGQRLTHENRLHQQLPDEPANHLCQGGIAPYAGGLGGDGRYLGASAP